MDEVHVPGGSRKSLRTVLLLAFLLTALTEVLNAVLSLLLFLPSTHAPFTSQNLIQLYDFLDSAIIFAFNPVVCFVAFYKISPSLVFQSSYDYLDLMEKSLIGAAIGSVVGFIAQEAILVAGGDSFASFAYLLGIIPLADLALATLSAAVGMMFLALTAVAFGHLRSGVLLAAGTDEGEKTAQPVDTPQ